MSWYSDKEKYQELHPDLPICEHCNRGFTAEECRKCKDAWYNMDDFEEEE